MLLDQLKRDIDKNLSFDWHEHDVLIALADKFLPEDFPLPSSFMLDQGFEGLYREKLAHAKILQVRGDKFKDYLDQGLYRGRVTFKTPVYLEFYPSLETGGEAFQGALLFTQLSGELFFGQPLEEGYLFMLLFADDNRHQPRYLHLIEDAVYPEAFETIPSNEAISTNALHNGMSRQEVIATLLDDQRMWAALCRLLVEHKLVSYKP